MTPAPLDVWIDTDPSIGIPCHEADDGFALIQAFRSPEIRIRGLSVSYGNASLRRVVPIAQEIVKRFGAEAGLTPEHVFVGAASRKEIGTETPATAALRAALEQRPLTYLAIAPLTNLATFLERHPELAGRIERVIFVGGRTPGHRFRAGNWNPYEFTDGNYHKDPRAMGVLLRAGIPLTLVPVELALRMPLTPAELRWIGREGGPAGRYLAQKARSWVWLWRMLFLVPGGILFDSFAILAATHPHLLESEHRFVAEHDSLDGEVSTERHKPYLLASKAPPDCEPAREAVFCCAPKPGAKAVLLERLAGKPREVVDRHFNVP